LQCIEKNSAFGIGFTCMHFRHWVREPFKIEENENCKTCQRSIEMKIYRLKNESNTEKAYNSDTFT
jgi:hypothetical protein